MGWDGMCGLVGRVGWDGAGRDMLMEVRGQGCGKGWTVKVEETRMLGERWKIRHLPCVQLTHPASLPFSQLADVAFQAQESRGALEEARAHIAQLEEQLQQVAVLQVRESQFCCILTSSAFR